jgi:hypothetical protein
MSKIQKLCKLKDGHFHHALGFGFPGDELLQAFHRFGGKELFTSFHIEARWNIFNHNQFTIYFECIFYF